MTLPDFSYGDEASASMTELYRLYRQRFEAISTKGEITSQGFYIVEEHVFPFLLHNGEEVSFIPAFDSRYSRMAIFIVNKDGKVLYKTDQLETNNQRKGELKQPNKGIAAVSFQDINGDGLIDLLLITFSENKKGSAGGKTYKVGDVLFQQKADKQVFYRDYRISNKINQYGMNKSIKFMTSYLAMDYSTEFLYTANTPEELKDKGFEVSTTRSFYEEFEKWGKHKMQQQLRLGDVVVDIEAHKVMKAGRPIDLTNKEFGLLVLFMNNVNVALFREVLYEKVWQEEYFSDSRTLDLHVQRLRKKLNRDQPVTESGRSSKSPRLITVYKVGYRLEVIK